MINGIEYEDRNGKIVDLERLPEVDRNDSEMRYFIMVGNNEGGTIVSKKDINRFTRMHLEDIQLGYSRGPLSLFRKPTSKEEEEHYSFNDFSVYVGGIDISTKKFFSEENN